MPMTAQAELFLGTAAAGIADAVLRDASPWHITT
jgi:hypothetical protein